MHASMRWFAVSAVMGLGCGDEPAPRTGQAVWGDACPTGMMASCPSSAHSVRGSQGSPAADIECQLTATTGGYNVFFRIAALGPMQQNFDESTEGLLARGFLPAVGQELRSTPAYSATVTVRGLGWNIRPVSTGPTDQCHVFIDNLSAGGFRGRISCINVLDDLTPSRQRIIRGGSGSMDPNYGEFIFTNCDTGS